MEKKYLPISLGAPGEDISTKDIFAIIQRFKNLNQYRLLSVQNFLQPRQRLFLELLPLIFHQNQPLLPGFISTETPAGIPDYTPNKNTLQAARQYSRSYRYTRKAALNHQIHGLFLMGSVGSIAFSRNSDMDIWLCHDPALSPVEITELQEKTDALEQWGLELNVEAHFFLINSHQFRAGQKTRLSSESSGSTQHFLLLDEFYRTAVYLAGKAPLWWLIPPEQEQNYNEYARHLIEKRFVSEKEVIDFGGLNGPPASEFISATLWHIYKSLASPYKSLLKLFLVECYASEFPNPQWLCLNIKNAIYSGRIDIEALDPYLMIYKKVEDYLHLVASQKQLQLSRQCFYLKIMGYAANALDPDSRRQRQQLIENIARESSWPEQLLESIGKLRYWDIGKATREHDVIRDQLKHSLHIIMRFASQHTDDRYRDNPELKLIGRKLHSFLQRKPGKVERITTRATILKKEAEVTIAEATQFHAEPLWRLYCGNLKHNQLAAHTALIEADSLTQIIAWLIINRLYHPGLSVNLLTLSSTITQGECQKMVSHLAQFLLSQRQSDDTLSVFDSPNQLTATLLFINLGETLPRASEEGHIVMSERSDPLSYGKDRVCFVQRVDLVSVSTWGEITTSRYEGSEGLLQCLTDTFNNSVRSDDEKNLHVHCYSPLRAHSIVLRIRAIYEQMQNYFSHPSHIRYFLPVGHQFLQFNLEQQSLQYRHLANNHELQAELESTQPVFSPVIMDPFVSTDSILPFLYINIKPETIHLFFQHIAQGINIYVIDEKAAFFFHSHYDQNSKQVLAQYACFLTNLIEKTYLQSVSEIKFHEVKLSSTGGFSCQPVKIKATEPQLILNIRVAAGAAAHEASPITIFCNDIEFSAQHCPNVYSAVRDFILDFRNDRETYPFHINEIDVPPRILGVSDIKQVHAVHYLRYKESIEQKLLPDSD